MATVVTVMDRDGFDQRTDNIVVVQPRRRRLLWVPRDVWSDVAGDRINTAYARGGHAGLREALAGLGISVDHGLCVPRSTVEAALADLTVTVPVEEPMHLWYPMAPRTAIEDGRKPVDFLPPREELTGERIHQWLGARYGRDASTRSSDLDRIGRQQVLVRALLRDHFDFARVLRGPVEPSLSGPGAIDDLRRVRAWWSFAWADQVADEEIGGRKVLRLLSPHPRPPRWRRAVRRLRPNRA